VAPVPHDLQLKAVDHRGVAHSRKKILPRNRRRLLASCRILQAGRRICRRVVMRDVRLGGALRGKARRLMRGAEEMGMIRYVVDIIRYSAVADRFAAVGFSYSPNSDSALIHRLHQISSPQCLCSTTTTKNRIPNICHPDPRPHACRRSDTWPRSIYRHNPYHVSALRFAAIVRSKTVQSVLVACREGGNE
jgi:hypothetical protein